MNLIIILIAITQIVPTDVFREQLEHAEFPTKAELINYPYVVRLSNYVNGVSKNVFGGIYIDNYWILTAAHRLNGDVISICMGEEYVPKTITCSDTKYSVNFTKPINKLDLNIAMVKIKNPFHASELAKLYSIRKGIKFDYLLEQPESCPCIILGWELLYPDDPMPYLRQGSVTISKNCDRQNGFCTLAGPNGGPCMGQAGSPLICNGQVVGIASKDDDIYCETRGTGYYTRIDTTAGANFIFSTLEGRGPDGGAAGGVDKNEEPKNKEGFKSGGHHNDDDDEESVGCCIRSNCIFCVISIFILIANL